MRLDQVLTGARRIGTRAGGAGSEITGLAYDNRLVTPGSLFFCVPGFTRDGHDFAADAAAGGAAALVVQRELDLELPQLLVDDVRAAGTNGKTTTAFLIRALLEADGRQTGLLGTVKSVVAGVEAEVTRTTPEALDLQRTFRKM